MHKCSISWFCDAVLYANAPTQTVSLGQGKKNASYLIIELNIYRDCL